VSQGTALYSRQVFRPEVLTHFSCTLFVLHAPPTSLWRFSLCNFLRSAVTSGLCCKCSVEGTPHGVLSVHAKVSCISAEDRASGNGAPSLSQCETNHMCREDCVTCLSVTLVAAVSCSSYSLHSARDDKKLKKHVAFVTYINFYLQWNITTWRWRTILSVTWRYQWKVGGHKWGAVVCLGTWHLELQPSTYSVPCCESVCGTYKYVPFVLPMLCCALVAQVQRLPTDALHCCGVCIAQGDYRLWATIGNTVIVTQKLNACHCEEQLKTFFLHARVSLISVVITIWPVKLCHCAVADCRVSQWN
jgi:hypothetical protein